MSQKLTLAVYLEQKGQKAKALKRIEAEAFGIPYPLQAGWPGRHGDMEVTPQMLEQVATARRVKVRPVAPVWGNEGHRNLRPGCDISHECQAEATRPSRFPGFVVRPALHHRAPRMTERQLTCETQRGREARVGAKMLLRAYDREGSGFTVEDLFHRLGFCRWLAEEIRISGPDVPAWKIDANHQNLQEKLFVIKLALKQLLGISESASPCDIPTHLGRHLVRESISRSMD